MEAPTTSSSTTPFRPKVIIFDLLTALLDSWSLWDRAAAAATADAADAAPSGTAPTGTEWRKAYLELTYGTGAYVAYETLVERSAAAVHLPREAPRHLLATWDQLRPWPETVATLRRLRRAGYRLGVVTNCSAGLGRRAAAALGPVAGDVAVVVTAEESGCYKPAAKPYTDALAALGVGPEDALFVAGSAADVPGASAVGMQVVWHNRVGLQSKGDVTPMREGRTLDEVLAPWL